MFNDMTGWQFRIGKGGKNDQNLMDIMQSEFLLSLMFRFFPCVIMIFARFSEDGEGNFVFLSLDWGKGKKRCALYNQHSLFSETSFSTRSKV